MIKRKQILELVKIKDQLKLLVQSYRITVHELANMHRQPRLQGVKQRWKFRNQMAWLVN